MAKGKTSHSSEREDSIQDKLVYLGRVTKVVKGGRRFGFASLVIAGDKKGRVGFGTGKAKEVTESKQKATQDAKRSLVKIPLRSGRTIHHEVKGRYGAGKVILRSAPPGTGIIAGGAMRAIFEMLGIQDIVAKSVGTSNPHNMVRATFDALSKLTSPKTIADKRSMKIGEVIGRREISLKKGREDGSEEKTSDGDANS